MDGDGFAELTSQEDENGTITMEMKTKGGLIYFKAITYQNGNEEITQDLNKDGQVDATYRREVVKDTSYYSEHLYDRNFDGHFEERYIISYDHINHLLRKTKERAENGHSTFTIISESTELWEEEENIRKAYPWNEAIDRPPFKIYPLIVPLIEKKLLLLPNALLKLGNVRFQRGNKTVLDFITQIYIEI